MSDDLNAAARRKGSFLGSMRAVAWSFFGIRHSSGLEHDASQLNPVHVVIAGLAGAAIFVIVLVLLARWAVAGGVGA